MYVDYAYAPQESFGSFPEDQAPEGAYVHVEYNPNCTTAAKESTCAEIL
jgi:hypothetical protein